MQALPPAGHHAGDGWPQFLTSPATLMLVATFLVLSFSVLLVVTKLMVTITPQSRLSGKLLLGEGF
ncbi:hypothetical protein D3C84_1009880 [compost metagenome]